MEMSEVMERGLNVDENGKVLDGFGNEYINLILSILSILS